MKNVGLVIKPKVKEASLVAVDICNWLRENGNIVCSDEQTHKIIGKKIKENNFVVCKPEDLPQKADPIITLGGDGTLIGIARYVSGLSPLMIGVNFGNLGFLTEISPQDALNTLKKVLEGKAQFAERAMLLARVKRQGKEIFLSQAVNDVVVQKGVRDKLLDLDISLDKEDVMRLRADGLIVATPTGSTAYSLSAGGSIVYPSLDVVLMTPICPHSLTNRPLILGINSSIGIKVPEYDGEVFLTVDGQISTALHSSDEIIIERAENKVRFVRSASKSYFEILRNKLNWGIANKFE